MIRTAIFGLGNVAERIHIPACRDLEEIQLVAASEPREERRLAIQRRFGLPAVYGDSAELIERERPDLVLVGTPPETHRDLCLLALRGGADVVCEKPFVSTVEEADDLIAAARRLGRALAVNTQYRHMEIYRQARQQWEGGEHGRLFFIQCWQQMFHPPAFEKLAWRRQLQRSTLFEFGTHALDLICFFFGALPETITATIPRVSTEHPSDVLVHAVLRFPGERLATLAFNRLSHAPERYLEMRLDGEHASMRISLGGVAQAGLELVRFRGTRSLQPRLSFVRGGETRVEARGRSRRLAREPRLAFASATAAHLREILARRAQDPQPWASAEHAREVLRAALAGYEYAETGRTVRL